MAKAAKTTVKESVKEEPKTVEKTVSGTKKIRMLRTYMGPFGCFYPGKTYEVEAKDAVLLIKNKDAIECM